LPSTAAITQDRVSARTRYKHKLYNKQFILSSLIDLFILCASVVYLLCCVDVGLPCRLDFAMPHGSYEGSMLFDLTAGMGFIFDSEAAVANVRQPLCQPITLTPKITQLLSWDCTHHHTPLPSPPSSSSSSSFFFPSTHLRYSLARFLDLIRLPARQHVRRFVLGVRSRPPSRPPVTAIANVCCVCCVCRVCVVCRVVLQICFEPGK
jgi:hypothetical protein